MGVTSKTVDRAFAAFHRRYVENATRAWDMDHHGRLWAQALASVESQDDSGFVKTLGELRSHWQIAFAMANNVADIKRVKGQPSLMAISKVLHFFKPRLFVIVDRAMVWGWVLMHDWIWRPMEATRERVDKLTGCNAEERDDSACDVASYVTVLISCGQLLRDNPRVMAQFAKFLRSKTTTTAVLLPDLETYAAAAVEWLLLGLVELPPAGVSI